MNNRIRQYLKASARLDKHDPQMLATVTDFKTDCGMFRRCIVFRRHELERLKDEYGDDLEVIISGN